LGCDSRLNGKLLNEQAVMSCHRGELRNSIATGYTKYVDDYGKPPNHPYNPGFVETLN
jgi:hypothetical protein